MFVNKFPAIAVYSSPSRLVKPSTKRLGRILNLLLVLAQNLGYLAIFNTLGLLSATFVFYFQPRKLLKSDAHYLLGYADLYAASDYKRLNSIMQLNHVRAATVYAVSSLQPINSLSLLTWTISSCQKDYTTQLTRLEAQLLSCRPDRFRLKTLDYKLTRH